MGFKTDHPDCQWLLLVSRKLPTQQRQGAAWQRGCVMPQGLHVVNPYVNYWAQRYAEAEWFLLLPLQTLEPRLGKILHKIIHTGPKIFTAEFSALQENVFGAQHIWPGKRKTNLYSKLRLNLRQVWSTPVCRAYSKDLGWLKISKAMCVKVKMESPGISGFASVLSLWQQPSCYCCMKPHFVGVMGASSSSDHCWVSHLLQSPLK